MNITIQNPFGLVKQAFEKYFPSLKYYGEGVFQQSEETGHRYVTTDQSPLPCSVNDSYEVVAFYVRENGNAENDGGFGSFGSFIRKVDCTLAVNAKKPITETQMALLLNNIRDIEYVSTDYNSEAVASTYFGALDQNFQTSFFSIRFRATEKIVCDIC